MKRIIIFGNSGSGKSTLAAEYAGKYKLPHLDLDTLAWKASSPPERKSLEDSSFEIDEFMKKNKNWLVEGGYSDLLGLIIDRADKVIFLNPGVEVCIENCKSRPWEPHKYESAEKQNQNLEMLLGWVRQYPMRDDEFSLISHQNLFTQFAGDKVEYKSNNRPS